MQLYWEWDCDWMLYSCAFFFIILVFCAWTTTFFWPNHKTNKQKKKIQYLANVKPDKVNMMTLKARMRPYFTVWNRVIYCSKNSMSANVEYISTGMFDKIYLSVWFVFLIVFCYINLSVARLMLHCDEQLANEVSVQFWWFVLAQQNS